MRATAKVGLVLGPLLAATVAYWPAPEGLAGPGQKALAVMCLCMVWWLTTPVAMPVTSLLGMALLPLLGVLDKNHAVELFGNQSVFFIIAVFIVAAVSVSTGLSTRITLWFLRRLSGSEDQLCAAVLGVATILTSVVVSHAVAALLLPIVIETLRALDLRPGSRFARRLLLSMAWGTICGSNISLLSSARASLAMGMYENYNLKNHFDLPPIGFFEFSRLTIPVALLSSVIAFFLLRWYHRPEGLSLAPAVERLAEKAKDLGPVKNSERITAVVVMLMVLALVVFGKTYGLGTVALLFAALLFILQVIDWETCESFVNWGVALLYGGAIAVSTAIEETHAVEYIVKNWLPLTSLPTWLLVLAIAALAAILTEFVSNAAVIALLLPLILVIAPEVGLSARTLTILLPLAAGLAFAFPMSTPAMAMVFGTGYLRPQDSAVPGMMLTLLGAVLIFLAAWWLWPLMGAPILELAHD